MEPYSFRAPDIRVLEQYELKKRVSPVVDALHNVTISLKELDRYVNFNFYLLVYCLLISTLEEAIAI